LLLPAVLAACQTDLANTSVFPTDDPPQPFPANYKPEILAFMRTYLNNPVGVREASIAEPVLREIGGRQFYVSCLHFTPRETDGSYKAMRERAAIFVNGRGDRVSDRTNEFCAGAVYAPFPELEKMAR